MHTLYKVAGVASDSIDHWNTGNYKEVGSRVSPGCAVVIVDHAYVNGMP